VIEKEYVLQMARYNAWQNSQLRDIVRKMDEVELMAERGAFFGSLFATLNHILWGDTLWMSRWCSDVPSPIGGPDHTNFCATAGDWDAARFRMDGRIRIWAQTLSNIDLCGTEEWYSAAVGKTMRQPRSLCVMHMFNHQTHHRGQVSQMLSELGRTPPVSDLIFMPEDA
jgi:uncharacterized damage-inducible protein DinB